MYMSNLLTNYFDDFINDDQFLFPFNGVSRKMLTGVPALNIEELDNEYEISMSIPGLSPKDIQVQLQDKVLTVSYKHEEEKKEKKKSKMLRQEFSHYSFNRSVTLPHSLDETSVHATSSKGMLTIVVKKQPEEKPKTITVEVRN
jgi:HSP20 family protein